MFYFFPLSFSLTIMSSSSPQQHRLLTLSFALLLLFLCFIDTTLSAMHMPSFSWDTPPVFIHMCNATGPFNETSLQFIAKFPMVTIEKGQGINATTVMPYASYYAEQKILEACQSIKAVAPDITCILYYNSILDWTMYQMHEKLI